MTATLTPPRSLDQRMDALDDGNAVRRSRAALRRRIGSEGRAGASTAAEWLLGNPEVIRTLEVGEFLLWVKFIGKPKARKLLAKRRIDPWCPIDELSAHHRRKLAGDLVGFANGARVGQTAHAAPGASAA